MAITVASIGASSDHFEAELQPVSQVFRGGVTAKFSNGGGAESEPELFLEELVRRTKPAVVCLRGFDNSGTGFFATETGCHRNQWTCRARGGISSYGAGRWPGA